MLTTLPTDIESYPEPEGRDRARVVVDAAISAVPVVGGPIQTLIDAIVAPKLSKRRDEWIVTLGADVQEALDRIDSLELDQMEQSDRLVTTILETTQIAMRTSEEEKLAALRAACVRAALPAEVDEVYERVFVRWIDELWPLHLQVLAYLEDPYGWFERNGIEREHYMAAPRLAPFKIAMPELANDETLRELVMRDLGQRGLADAAGLAGSVSENSVYSPLVSELGRKFLRFIRLPWNE